MGRGGLELLAAVEVIRADPQVLAARVGLDAFLLELGREHFRLRIPESDKCAMVVACATYRNKRFQNNFLLEAVIAYARDPELERDFEPGERLEGRQHRRRGLEPRVPARAEARRVGPLVSEDVLLGEPAGVERAQA